MWVGFLSVETEIIHDDVIHQVSYYATSIISALLHSKIFLTWWNEKRPELAKRKDERDMPVKALVELITLIMG